MTTNYEAFLGAQTLYALMVDSSIIATCSAHLGWYSGMRGTEVGCKSGGGGYKVCHCFFWSVMHLVAPLRTAYRCRLPTPNRNCGRIFRVQPPLKVRFQNRRKVRVRRIFQFSWGGLSRAARIVRTAQTPPLRVNLHLRHPKRASTLASRVLTDLCSVLLPMVSD